MARKSLPDAARSLTAPPPPTPAAMLADMLPTPCSSRLPPVAATTPPPCAAPLPLHAPPEMRTVTESDATQPPDPDRALLLLPEQLLRARTKNPSICSSSAGTSPAAIAPPVAAVWDVREVSLAVTWLLLASSAPPATAAELDVKLQRCKLRRGHETAAIAPPCSTPLLRVKVDASMSGAEAVAITAAPCTLAVLESNVQLITYGLCRRRKRKHSAWTAHARAYSLLCERGQCHKAGATKLAGIWALAAPRVASLPCTPQEPCRVIPYKQLCALLQQ